jgi:hypothetical protein
MNYALCQVFRDTRYPAQIVDGGVSHAIETAEVRQQTAAALGADANDIFECRTTAGFGAAGAMTDNREAVRFIANFLNEMKSSVVHG